MNYLIHFFRRPIFSNPFFILIIFGIVAIAISLKEFFGNTIDSYVCFRYSFFHLIENKDLYAKYPNEYYTLYNYAPMFALVMGLWAYFPLGLGVVVWNFSHTFNFLFAIKNLPIEKKHQVFIAWFCLQEMITTLMSVQTNASVTAFMIGFFILCEKKQFFWASGLLIFGTFFKIYVIIAGAMYIFYPQKLKFIAYSLFWAMVCFFMPIIFISPEQIVFLYKQWFLQLQSHAERESMTVMGFINTAILGYRIEHFWVIVPAILITIGVWLKLKQYQNTHFKMLYLASLLIFAVIFNPGTESPTFIIAITGVALWYILNPKSIWTTSLLIFVFIFSCLAPTDLFPTFIRRGFFEPYQIKAIPCFWVWLVCMYQLYFYEKIESFEKNYNTF